MKTGLIILFAVLFSADAYGMDIRETKVVATVTADYGLQKDMDGPFVWTGSLKAGERVEVLRDYSEKWYLVRSLKTDASGWVRKGSLHIPADTRSNKSRLTKEKLETYVNSAGFWSDTDYFILTDTDRQLVHIFRGGKRAWGLDRTFVCATGKNASPTVRGLFKTGESGDRFFSERLKSGGRYWTRFFGPYLFHSLPTDRDGNVTDATLGERCSNGCIRLSVADAEWIYRNIPAGTGVFIT